VGSTEWTPAVAAGIDLGTSGAFDDAGTGFGDFIYADGRFWLFYTGVPTAGSHVGEALGVAYADSPQLGFDTAWGKGPAT